jgi:flagellar hook-associated protein 3 FlgL
MRIPTRQAFESGLEHLQQRQRELSQAQEQLTSGKRVVRASDDPAAAARAERALAAIGRSEADQRALDASRNAMTLAEGALGDAGELLQQAREALVAAGNGSYGDAERAGVAQQLAALRAQLLAVANRGDGGGAFLFAGQGSSGAPFVDAGGGVAWRGSDGTTQAALDEPMPLAADGRAAWLGAARGNGLFETRVLSPNAAQAQGWIDAGRVTDPAAFFAATSPPVVADPAQLDYRIDIAQVGGQTRFTVTKDGAPTALTDQPLQSGQTIEIDGMAFAIHGTPQPGEAFELRLATPTQSVFDVLDAAVAELRTPLRSAAAVTQGVQRGLTALDASIGALGSLRSRIGETLNRADAMQARIGAQKVGAQAQKSQAEDLDMVDAISAFQNRQSGYQAALQAYASVQRLSLFQYLDGF